jgi:hypothetical protein
MSASLTGTLLTRCQPHARSTLDLKACIISQILMYHCVRELCASSGLWLFLLYMLPLRVTDTPSYIFLAKHIVSAMSTSTPIPSLICDIPIVMWSSEQRVPPGIMVDEVVYAVRRGCVVSDCAIDACPSDVDGRKAVVFSSLSSGL